MEIVFVVYEGPDEVLITSLEKEAEMLHEYFAENCGRNIDDYDRSIITKTSCLRVISELKLRV